MQLINKIKSLRHKAYLACCRKLLIQQNKVILWSDDFKTFGCSPKYIALYLAEHYPEKYDVVWVLDKQKALEDRLNYLPTKLPDLEAMCAQSFLRFSANILCKMYQASDMESVHSGLDLLMAHHGQLRRYANKYERLYLPLLKTKYGRRWVLNNDFEPIQKIIRRLKK